MRLVRTTAVFVLLQGLLALLTLKTGGGGVFLVTSIYVLLAAGLWRAEQWAMFVGIALTAPQVVVISSWTVSWSWFVGITTGVGVGVYPDAPVPRMIGFGLHGTHLIVGHFGFVRSLVFGLTLGDPVPFFGLNLVALYVLVLMLICWWRGPKTADHRT